MLSQALRRLGRAVVPLPPFAVGGLGSVLRRAGAADFSPEKLAVLTYGRGVDTARRRSKLGFEPRFTTEQAFAAFAASMTRARVRVRSGTRVCVQIDPVER